MPKSNKRFVAMIMSVMILLIGGILLIVYFTTSVQTKKENKEMLQVFADSYEKNGFPDVIDNLPDLADGEAPPDLSDTDGKPDLSDPPPGFIVNKEEGSEMETSYSHLYEISTFYAVVFDLDGNMKEYFNESSSPFSNEELVKYASDLLDNNDTFHQGKSVTSLVTYGEDYILVTMMDTAATDNAISHLVTNMIIFGAISIVVIFILSFYLAKWVMRPAEVGYEKQKQFISDAGHELKTPISTISANLEVLKREIGQNRWLENISYENERMFTLVCQLLDLAKLESATLELSDVDLSLLCEAVILPFEASAYERGVKFSYHIEKNIHIRGNGVALEKLVSVLTDNAVSHCLTPGEVFIELSQKSGKGRLKVSNTGSPLSEENQKHLFERFYKFDESRVEEKGHYGLGLSIAKAAADEMGAEIYVECQEDKVSFIVDFK
ncbi:MAG: HAMP domain-containing histidine kinase [Lachnospiraceae bacterium]|nr:HAMP domain-containing histidine kinase [Lachnospiraceae bacterium]